MGVISTSKYPLKTEPGKSIITYPGYAECEIMMLDINTFRITEGTFPQPKKQLRRAKGSFLKGPIPTNWLTVAGNLPGKTLHVGIALWLAYGFEKHFRFRFTPKWHGWLNIGPRALRDALHRLKEAGLICLESRDGCSPIVTILEAPEEPKP